MSGTTRRSPGWGATPADADGDAAALGPMDVTGVVPSSLLLPSERDRTSERDRGPGPGTGMRSRLGWSGLTRSLLRAESPGSSSTPWRTRWRRTASLNRRRPGSDAPLRAGPFDPTPRDSTALPGRSPRAPGRRPPGPAYSRSAAGIAIRPWRSISISWEVDAHSRARFRSLFPEAARSSIDSICCSNWSGVHSDRQPSWYWVRYPPCSNGPRNFDGRITLPLSSSECSYLPKNRATGDCSHNAPRSAQNPTVRIPPFHTTLRHFTPRPPTGQPPGTNTGQTAPRFRTEIGGSTASGVIATTVMSKGERNRNASGPRARRWATRRRGAAQGRASMKAVTIPARSTGGLRGRSSEIGHPDHRPTQLDRGRLALLGRHGQYIQQRDGSQRRTHAP